MQPKSRMLTYRPLTGGKTQHPAWFRSASIQDQHMYKLSFSKNSPQLQSVAAAWLSALLAGLLCAVPAYAPQEDDDEDRPPMNEFESTPFLGFTAGGEFEDPNRSRDRDLDAAASYGVIAGFAADYNKHYELLFSNQSTEVEGTSNLDLDVQYVH